MDAGRYDTLFFSISPSQGCSVVDSIPSSKVSSFVLPSVPCTEISEQYTTLITALPSAARFTHRVYSSQSLLIGMIMHGKIDLVCTDGV